MSKGHDSLRAAIAVACVALSLASCDREANSGLKGQVNTTISFHGLAVDQEGHPLPEARIVYRVEAYPKNWTYETRGRPYETSTVSVTSGADGRFNFSATGCMLKLVEAECGGYRHLVEEDTSDGRATTYAYRLIASSDLWYKSDPENPAVYVFVKDGVSEVSALPSRGGADSGGGSHWRPNMPAWPQKPSLKDVVQKQHGSEQ